MSLYAFCFDYNSETERIGVFVPFLHCWKMNLLYSIGRQSCRFAFDLVMHAASTINTSKIQLTKHHINGCAIKCIQSASAFFVYSPKPDNEWVIKSWHFKITHNDATKAISHSKPCTWIWKNHRSRMHFRLSNRNLFGNIQFFGGWSMGIFDTHILNMFLFNRHMNFINSILQEPLSLTRQSLYFWKWFSHFRLRFKQHSKSIHNPIL